MISSYVMQYISNLFLPCSLFFALWVNHLQTVLPCFEFPQKMEYTCMIDIFLINTVILKLFWICISVLVLSADHESERGKHKTGANVSLFIMNTVMLCIKVWLSNITYYFILKIRGHIISWSIKRNYDFMTLIIIINSWKMLISGWELPTNSGKIEPPQIKLFHDISNHPSEWRT